MSMMSPETSEASPSSEAEPNALDPLTIAAAGILAYAFAILLHEGLGHGAACVLTGCKPGFLTSMNFDGDASHIGDAANRWIAAAGTIVNLIIGGITYAGLRRARHAAPALRYLLWLFGTVNLMLGTGYLLYSGISGGGDWAAVVGGWQPAGLWRALLILVGFVSYYLTVFTALYALRPFLGNNPKARMKRAYQLTFTPYLAGALLSVIAGMFNPGGLMLVLASGVAASLGGTSGLVWGPQFLHGPRFAPWPHPALGIARHNGILIAALIVAAIFIGILGPGIRFGPH